jgi:CHAT domain-containing protein
MSLNFFAQEKLDSALFFVEKATFIHQQTYQGVNSDYMRLIEQKGEILEALKRESDAIRLWQSFLESVDSTNDFFAIRIQLRLAVLLAQTGDCKQAKHWRQSVAQNWESHTELKQNYLQRQFIFHHIALATQVCDSLGQHAMVVDSLLDQSLAAFDHLLKADVSSDSREWILDLRLPLFESSVSNLWTLAQDKPEDGYDEDLLRIMEKNKSSLLHIALQQADSRLSDKRSVQLAEQEMKIKRDLRYYERKIFEQNAIPPSANNREKWYAKKFEAQQQLDSLLVRIQQEDARYYELRYAEKSLQLPEIKDLLGPNQCLISYFWGDKQLYAARITQADGLRIYQLEKGTAQLIDSFLQSIWAYPLNQMESGQSEKSYNARYRQLALTCYEKWLLPLDISSYPELIIIPDGPLSYLPFEVLLSQSPPEEALYRDYPYLLKSHSIAYAFSINHWLRQQGKSFIGQNGLLAIAPQFSATPTQANRGEGQLKALYFNKEEAQEIADQWDGDVLVDEAASLDNFLKNAPDYPILHLSTHAMLNDRDSRYTYIAFAPQSDSVADKLFFSDLLAMQLKAEMVVLSACETAQGSWQHGEGINSLARGFAYAGAKSLVPTLWAVDDQSTAALMTYFYQELKRGKNKAEALQLAKLKILQERDLPPFYWAAPILIGNTQAITSHAAYKYLIFIGISILLALIVAWFWRKNKKR